MKEKSKYDISEKTAKEIEIFVEDFKILKPELNNEQILMVYLLWKIDNLK